MVFELLDLCLRNTFLRNQNLFICVRL